jgi:hypothetical protein
MLCVESASRLRIGQQPRTNGGMSVHLRHGCLLSGRGRSANDRTADFLTARDP